LTYAHATPAGGGRRRWPTLDSRSRRMSRRNPGAARPASGSVARR